MCNIQLRLCQALLCLLPTLLTLAQIKTKSLESRRNCFVGFSRGGRPSFLRACFDTLWLFPVLVPKPCTGRWQRRWTDAQWQGELLQWRNQPWQSLEEGCRKGRPGVCCYEVKQRNVTARVNETTAVLWAMSSVADFRHGHRHSWPRSNKNLPPWKQARKPMSPRQNLPPKWRTCPPFHAPLTAGISDLSRFVVGIKVKWG